MTTAQEYQKHCDALELVTKLQESLEAYLALDPRINVLLKEEREQAEDFLAAIYEQRDCHFTWANRTGKNAINETKK